ncbi:hypothetical protein [Noviherbaspirillum malthae]|uniref:hypothetical protein n=1 Tax=Noviherbaspirillum malthae TaxID=1260987 RepID=UPI00189071FA|nr:hypothetical protein [Noviherbaspirillum malthae]
MSNSAEDKIEAFLIAPFKIWDVAKRVVMSSKSKPKRIEKEVAVPEAVDLPPPFASACYTVADRVHSQMFGTLKVCFYHHYKAKVIRIVARKNGFVKEVLFTPSIADARCAPFGMDSAIAFVREKGFTTDSTRVEAITDSHQANHSAPSSGRDPSRSLATKRNASPTKRLARKSVTETTTANYSKNRPFTGHIIEIGETTRPGRDGSPPYSTFLVKLRSEGDFLEKEFYGEHLAELAEKYDLACGQLIRLQLLGRIKFEVETAGRVEERHRNEYSIDIIS